MLPTEVPPTEIPTAVPPTSTAAPLPVLRYVGLKIYDPVYIALENGFFQKNGLDVQIASTVQGGPNAIQLVASGKADGGVSSIFAIINANAAGLPVVGVTDLQTSSDKQQLQKWYVLKDSPIQEFKDVIGKVYAVNLLKSSFHYTTLIKAAQEAIPEDQLNITVLPFDKQVLALEAGEIDVAGLMVPYQTLLEGKYPDTVRVLFDDYHDVFGEQEKQFSLIFVNRIWAENHPEQATAFAKSIAEAAEWTKANQKEAAQIISKYTGVEVQYVPDYFFTPNAEVRTADIEYWMKYMKERGDLTVDWVTPEMIGTNQYNPYVK